MCLSVLIIIVCAFFWLFIYLLIYFFILHIYLFIHLFIHFLYFFILVIPSVFFIHYMYYYYFVMKLLILIKKVSIHSFLSFFLIGLSTFLGLLGTVIIILLVSYFRNIKYELLLYKKTLLPNNNNIYKHSIKLFYTGNMPIILFLSFVNNIFIISQFMSVKYPKVPLVKLLGVWKVEGENSGENSVHFHDNIRIKINQ